MCVYLCVCQTVGYNDKLVIFQRVQMAYWILKDCKREDVMNMMINMILWGRSLDTYIKCVFIQKQPYVAIDYRPERLHKINGTYHNDINEINGTYHNDIRTKASLGPDSIVVFENVDLREVWKRLTNIL